MFSSCIFSVAISSYLEGKKEKVKTLEEGQRTRFSRDILKFSAEILEGMEWGSQMQKT